MIFLHGRMVDWNAWIVDDLVYDAVRVDLRRPAEIVDSLRPVALAAGIYFVDRAPLPQLAARSMEMA